MKAHAEYLRTLSDAQLVKLFQEDDNMAMDVLVERHAIILLPFLTNVLHNKDDAGDVLQDTWLIVILRLHHGAYREENNFGKWLKTIAYRKAINFLVQKHRLSKVKMDAKTYFVADMKSKDLIAINLTVLKEAIETLFIGQMRKIAILHLLEKIPLNDIAAMLGITQKAVSSAFSKICKRLRKMHLSGE